MAFRVRWSDEQKQCFVAALRKTANVTAAAEQAGVSRRQAYAMRKRDRDFRKVWDDAVQAAIDELEAALRQRALDGVEQPVFYGGKECGRVRTYNDALGMFLLRGRRADVFNVRSTSPSRDEENGGYMGNARTMLLNRLAGMRRSAPADRSSQS